MVVASTVTMIGDSLDRVLLGAGLGARFVTYYAVPQNLVTRLNMLPNALVRTLFPRLSAMERDHADALVRHALEFLNGVFTPVMIVAMLALGPFLRVWIGIDLAAASVNVGRILIVSVWLVGQAGITRLLIQSQIAPARAAWIGIVQLPFFGGVLVFGITHFGLTGAAAVVVLRSLVDYGVLLHLSSIRARPIVLDMLGHLTFLGASAYLAHVLTNLSTLVAVAACLACANFSWSMLTSPSLRGIVCTLLLRVNPARSG
jgi:O-antigen/teichoic acid export membrane protein